MTSRNVKKQVSKTQGRRPGKSAHKTAVLLKDGPVGLGRGASPSEALKAALNSAQLCGKQSKHLSPPKSARSPSTRIDVDVQRIHLAEDLGLSKKQLAETAGLAPEALYKRQRLGAAKTQTRLREMNEILIRVADWAGGKPQAMAWYRAEPIPAFGGRTAESLVKSGQAGPLRDYLDSLALGGFA